MVLETSRVFALNISVAPTFQDNFNTGVLNPAWQVSNYSVANYAGAGSKVTFSPSMVDLSQGCLCLKLTQPTAKTSTCGEIELNQTFGYGTYQYVMRSSSTSQTPTGAGSAVSGQVSATFIYLPDANYNSVTEIDAPEIEGQFPNQLEYTNWANGASTEKIVPFAVPDEAFHSYKFQWFSGSVKFFVDGILEATITSDVPTQAAHPIINHWGSNSSRFGGLATVGIERYMYVKQFSFWAGIAV